MIMSPNHHNHHHHHEVPRNDKYRALWMRNQGVARMLLAQLISSFMAVAAKLLQTPQVIAQPLESRQIILMMMSIALVWDWIWMFCTRVPEAPMGPKKAWSLLTIRGIAGVLGIWGFYYSLSVLPISEATVINFLAPLIAALASGCLGRVRPSLSHLVAVTVSVSGMILVSQPWNASNEVLPPKPLSPPAFPRRLLATLAALVGAIGGAIGYLALSLIGNTAHATITVHHFALWTVVGTSLSYLLTGTETLQFPSLAAWLLLAFLGTFALLLHVLVAASLQAEDCTRALNMVYIQIIFAGLMDKVVWNHTPNATSLLGMALILGSVIAVAVVNDQGVSDRGGGAQCLGGCELEIGWHLASLAVDTSEMHTLPLDMDIH